MEIPFIETEKTRGRTDVKWKDILNEFNLSSTQDFQITILLGVLVSQERGLHL